jgi:hypothetical protein
VSLARGAVACTTILAASASAGCGGVEIADPGLPTEQENACRALLEELPAELGGLERVEVEPEDALGAAWGDPAIELRCVAEMPEGHSRISDCTEINGVGWYTPDSQLTHFDADLTMSTIGFEPVVELRIPVDYRPPLDQLAQIAAPIKETLEVTSRCQ